MFFVWKYTPNTRYGISFGVGLHLKFEPTPYMKISRKKYKIKIKEKNYE